MKQAPIFSTIEQYELSKIIDTVKPANYKAGDQIIREVNTQIYKEMSREMMGISFTYLNLEKPMLVSLKGAKNR